MTATAPRRPMAAEAPVVEERAPIVRSAAARRVIAAMRIIVGFTFLWAFIDKAFGLGYSTQAGSGWVEGGSPTSGYLMGSSEGWLGGMFGAMSGVAVVDWLFMLGLLGVGVALLAGIGLRIAAVAGIAMALMMYLSQLPLTEGATNPVTTSHWYYVVMFALFPLVDAGRTWGLAGLWEKAPLVRNAAWLR